jgi:uncharacterized membrane protein YcaP (DUF421 family)
VWSNLLVNPIGAVGVVLSAIGMYCTFLILVRLFGQRTLSNMSTFDFAAVIAMGAVAGRAILGDTPTLEAGMIGLATLFILQAVAGHLRRHRLAAAAMSNRPLLLVAGGQVLRENLVRSHIVEAELHAKLRLAGVRNTSELACVILESTGAVSILRRGEPIDPALLDGVTGAEQLPPELLQPAPPPAAP